MDRFHTVHIKSYSIQNHNVAVQAFWVCLFSLLTAVGAQIEIPHQPVPYTLQTFFVLLSGALLGKEKGGMSQLLYLFVGTLGVPVFSGFGFGATRLIGPTGGYLLSFPIAAYAVGYLIKQNKSLVWSLVSMFVGLFIVFSLGTIQLNVLYIHHWSEAIVNGFLIFSWWDGIKLFAAATIYHEISRRRIS